MWQGLVSDFHLISDDESVRNDTGSVLQVDNRHDQSLLSLLLKANTRQNWPCGKLYKAASQTHDAAARPPLWMASEPNASQQTSARQAHPEFGIPGLAVCFTGAHAERIFDCGE